MQSSGMKHGTSTLIISEKSLWFYHKDREQTEIMTLHPATTKDTFYDNIKLN